MKRLFFLTLVSVVVLSISASAQPPRDEKNHDDWVQRMKSEKIAYLTDKLSLSPEEAQAFWPVYNQIENKKRELVIASMKAYHELEGAVKENKSEKELSSLLNAYLEANRKASAKEPDFAAQLGKVISQEKVAKLYVAEECFRREQIHKLRH